MEDVAKRHHADIASTLEVKMIQNDLLSLTNIYNTLQPIILSHIFLDCKDDVSVVLLMQYYPQITTNSFFLVSSFKTASNPKFWKTIQRATSCVAVLLLMLFSLL